MRLEGLPLPGVAHAGAALAVEQKRLRMRAGLDAQIAPRARRIEVDARRAHAPASMNRALRHRDAFLIATVVVGVAGDADALRGGKQTVVERTALVDVV